MVCENDIKKFTNFVSCYNNFIIVGHKGPDGDCLCSTIALADLLHRMGKQAFLVSAGPFVKEETLIFEKHFTSEVPDLDKNDSAVIIADCSELHRLGNVADSVADYPRFIIDHHKTADASEDFSIIRPKSPATCFLVQLIYEKIVGKIPENIAKVLFFGLCTDSGFFRYLEDDSGPIFEAASRLVQSGANPKRTYGIISSGKPAESRKWLGEMFSRMEFLFDDKLICICEEEDVAKRFGSNNRDTATLYDQLLCIKGVEAVLFIRQDDREPSISVSSFRSVEHFDVSAIAAELGGGGHKNAAGLSLNCTIEEAKSRILNVAKDFLDKNRNSPLKS